MRRAISILSMYLLVLATTPGTSFATSGAHFFSATSSVNTTNPEFAFGALVVDFDEAGLGNISGEVAYSLTVTNATITSVLVSPANVSIPTGGLQNFTATGVFSDSTTQNITILVSWSSDKTVIATVGNAPNSGFATGVSAGTANISATFTFAVVPGVR